MNNNFIPEKVIGISINQESIHDLKCMRGTDIFGATIDLETGKLNITANSKDLREEIQAKGLDLMTECLKTYVDTRVEELRDRLYDMCELKRD